MKEVQNLAKAIKAGGVAIFPTDTIYGLGCDINSPQAIERIYTIKQRNRRTPLSLLVNSLSEINNYAQIGKWQEFVANYITKPVTFILPYKTGIINFTSINSANNGAIGMRMPNSKFILDLLELVGNPIIATSVNISGEPPLLDLKNLSPKLAAQVDYISSEPLQALGEPSTVVDLTSDNPKILRQGAQKLEF